MKCSLTILFEDPFWIGLYERFDEDKYEVCKITFDLLCGPGAFVRRE